MSRLDVELSLFHSLYQRSIASPPEAFPKSYPGVVSTSTHDRKSQPFKSAGESRMLTYSSRRINLFVHQHIALNGKGKRMRQVSQSQPTRYASKSFIKPEVSLVKQMIAHHQQISKPSSSLEGNDRGLSKKETIQPRREIRLVGPGARVCADSSRFPVSSGCGLSCRIEEPARFQSRRKRIKPSWKTLLWFLVSGVSVLKPIAAH
jgi:hypothetical protein